MILIINGGSSSLKASLFTENLELVSQFHLDQIGLRSSHYKFVHDEQVIVKKEKIKNHLQGIKILINFLPLQKIKLIGHRVVHGGDTFVKPTKIDLRTLYRLEKLNDLAPLHNPVNLEIIKACRKTMKKIPNYAIFDTAYYSDLPKESSHYALPDEFMKKFKIRKYGFHGISHKYVTNLAIQNLNIKNPRIISCHLGGGCSVTASKNGKALETSMGFTPLSGVVMGTRSGFYLTE
jgi:acetate kinase